MKKTTKGAVAAGAAALLLAGGAGSFAAWNASTGTGDATTVTAGSLAVQQAGDTGTWKWANGNDFDPATQKLVPGDVVKYTASYKIDLVGTNLKADLKPTIGGLEGDLANYLTVVPAADTVTSYSTVNGVLSQTVDFTTEVKFDGNGTPIVAKEGMNLTGSLAGGSVTLEQKIGS